MQTNPENELFLSEMLIFRTITNWDCMNEMSKCDTGNISFCMTSQKIHSSGIIRKSTRIYSPLQTIKLLCTPNFRFTLLRALNLKENKDKHIMGWGGKGSVTFAHLIDAIPI